MASTVFCRSIDVFRWLLTVLPVIGCEVGAAVGVAVAPAPSGRIVDEIVGVGDGVGVGDIGRAVREGLPDIPPRRSM